MSRLVSYNDSIYILNNKSTLDTSEYVKIASQTIKERFCHGTIDYTFSENWIAWLCGKVLWSHMSAMVISEDILKHGNGLCSQQTIVLMQSLIEKGISVRSVGLGYKEGPGHFLCEVRYDGDWHLHDVSVEPVWGKIENHHKSLEYYLDHTDSLYLAYESRLPKNLFDKILEKHEYGKTNHIPGANMSLFHRTSHLITVIFPILFLFLLLLRIRRTNTVNKKEPYSSSVKKQNENLVVSGELNV